MAFYLHTEYNWLALAPGDDPGGVNVDTSSEPAIFEERTTAFWDVFGALWSTNTSPKAPDADAPLQHGVVSEWHVSSWQPSLSHFLHALIRDSPPLELDLLCSCVSKVTLIFAHVTLSRLENHARELALL
ncbi:hypothetical protein BJ138DRAFT_1117679 [Hygrophoropsis aurantiaca]|uniref:Uncharacterized protein n=1 Tax=Hygrophoropsis aurantiaca TaxID=72124 RepID=A0ACB8A021_9AGAM|nr:hypothetical protein BJ138DRAFT_1117679 [Hygrophoropsis aurantiaca]